MLSTLKKIKQGSRLNSNGQEGPLEWVTSELRNEYGGVFPGKESASDNDPTN